MQDMPGSVPQLQVELQRVRGERDALEARLKLLLKTRRAAGDSSAAAEASAAAAQLQSTAGAPGVHGVRLTTRPSFLAKQGAAQAVSWEDVCASM